ncbi:2-methylaconitate cis-trans isomerase PrpF family protein [uncultured Arthrobacter sp.]|uniref:2-methylaconitate cis-trans isomerase PrpF family protein n=1 Tax=uncultured Arthrobacter sp. TaxID=114050 RepID=UPI0026293D78|nr:PrpF domain-containing protein [uncultured Arthrobacter sp.]
MSTTRSIPCLFARAGTSRGAFFLKEDLPTDPAVRDAVVLAAYGSPDSRQIDGIGGGDPLTSKVAVVSASSRPEADVDYTFGQVGIDVGEIFWVGNCGNMSSGVGPFAIRRGLVPAVSPITQVRIYNTNTNKLLIADVRVNAAGEVEEDGDTTISGVPGSGAPILLDFGDCGGAATGSVLPTGQTCEPVTLSNGTTCQVSIVDAATPFVFVNAKDLSMTGTESAAQIDAHPSLPGLLEEVRAYAARAIGLVSGNQVAKEVSPSIPRVVAVSQPQDYIAADGTLIPAETLTVIARQQSMQRTHKTYAVTGALCTAIAGAIEGTIVNQVAKPTGKHFVIGHPGGIISAQVKVDVRGADIAVCKASIVRTARAIMDGSVIIPSKVWDNAGKPLATAGLL